MTWPPQSLGGKLVGIEATASLGGSVVGSEGEIAALRRELATVEGRYRGGAGVATGSALTAGRKKRFVCFCEDVVAGDIADAIDEGFDDIQMLKRYSTVTMGPCQGKMCLKSFVDICAQRSGRSISETGVTTSRPPVQPVPLGVLAGPSHMPIKRTPLDRRHRDLGAHMVDLGPWQRAYSYGSSQEEYRAVRERVGIIDVSSLGKLDFRGQDTTALLDRIYTHRFSDLASREDSLRGTVRRQRVDP